jgi:F0F1-type ATP synthase membrane subunit b/b'
MTKEIKKLRTYEKKLKDKLEEFQRQLSQYVEDEKEIRLKNLSRAISQTQDVCDKINTLLYSMIK